MLLFKRELILCSKLIVHGGFDAFIFIEYFAKLVKHFVSFWPFTYLSSNLPCVIFLCLPLARCEGSKSRLSNCKVRTAAAAAARIPERRKRFSNAAQAAQAARSSSSIHCVEQQQQQQLLWLFLVLAPLAPRPCSSSRTGPFVTPGDSS